MTVFKTFLKVLISYKFTILLYSAMLVFFGAFMVQTSEPTDNFVASKPKALIVSYDEEVGLTKDLITYLEKNMQIVDVEGKDNINDALFYRDINYIIYIPDNFRTDFLNNKNPQIEIKSTGNYQASLADMILKRYINVGNIYSKTATSEEALIKSINQTLEKETYIEMTSKLDVNNLNKAALYYNFANYSILAGCIYVVCLVLSSFKKLTIKKRTIISSMNHQTFNRKLLLANSLYAFLLWLFFVIISIILIGDVMFTPHGLMMILNSFIFMFCALTIAFLLGTVLMNKEAINGIVNVIALGTSFLCGAFVPMEWLPTTVINIAKFLPSYYYISNNNSIVKIETINLTNLQPILMNMGMIVIFIAVFIIATNIISKKKRVIG